jgi:alginate O-acetyltransferase complex protein AlgI
MLFDSAVFIFFFGAFALLYWLTRDSLIQRNILIVLASGTFYAYWDVRFLMLLAFTACLDFVMALLVQKAPTAKRKRVFLAISLTGNLGVLGFFKYYNFFVESFAGMFQNLGVHLRLESLSIVLPVGISFYTFQSMSYVIDVYRKQIPASRNIIEFLAYISFFPQLVAGPIERATNLLPQFQQTRTVTRSDMDVRIWFILAGFFKKIVIADNLAPYADLAFSHPDPGAALMIAGTVGFAFQIYCDFSGYSDIAVGLAKSLGFDLIRNFSAHFSFQLVQGLRLHSSWRKQKYLDTDLFQLADCNDARGSLAWRSRQFSLLGILACGRLNHL